MTGILLIAVAIAWLIAVVTVTRWVARRFNSLTMKVVSCLVLFPALMAAPLADELIGKRQFEQLCNDNSTIQVDRATAVGRTVYFVPKRDIEAQGTWVRVVLQPHQFVDATTGETVVSYTTLTAVGGRFIRTLGISEGGMPLTFNGSCGPKENARDLFKSLGVTALDQPLSSAKGK